MILNQTFTLSLSVVLLLTFILIVLCSFITHLFLRRRVLQQLKNAENDYLQRLALVEQQYSYEIRAETQKQEAFLADNCALKAQLDSANKDHKEADGQLQQLQKQLALMQQQVEDLKPLKERLLQRDQQYENLLVNHKTLEARREEEHKHLKAQLQLLQENKQQLTQEFEQLANRIFDVKQQQFSRQSQQTLELTLNPVKDQLKSFREKLESAYDKEAAERNQLVGQIAELQKQTRQIGEDAVNLTNALKGDKKTQGNWGEVILERLLEESGLQKGREYETQVALNEEQGKRRNPDVIIRLPENKDIVIDAKVSLVDYERYCSATDEAVKALALKQHIASVRNHVMQLSLKSYESLLGIRSLDFVFIFIPIEPAFMLALQEDPALFQDAYSRHIIIVSPTTLLATLRTVENIWRYEKQNKHAERIAQEAGSLYDQFVLLLESLDDVGRFLQRSQESLDTARKRLGSGRGNLLRRVENMKTLGIKAKKQIRQDLLDEAEVDDVGEEDSLITYDENHLQD